MDRWSGTPRGPKKYKISGLTNFQKIKTIPFQGDHSKFEFLECCLKKADDPPGGGGLRPPPWGILAFSRNREIRSSSDRLGKGFFVFLEICSKPTFLYFCSVRKYMEISEVVFKLFFDN